MGTTQSPRSDTRARIVAIALELFSEQGYERTSLREIADRLGVTKAALYYHFKTKEDIVHGIVATTAAPIDELISWGREQTWTPEVRDELIRRFAAGMADRAPLLRFFQENQPALRDLPAGQEFRDRMIALVRLVHGPGATFEDRLRAMMSLFTINSALFLLYQDRRPEVDRFVGDIPVAEATREEAIEAAQHVALEICRLIVRPTPTD
ncbi:TetR/AcrR family transcriptional regulator [Kitasatospora purpeofusca]|uniref:TetR/AcrR family transcriptional regulator n=1 Tax=Kitasatospora purpeofusca TaxID=67352 RepID=UPI002252531F|nr:TetR/AcrR family transcriptional regulator [Kitasatospora purpeofusca]MCX4686266.1 TetR/AcrR family transcriptional regulator [Kitasatospora purpeofusca]MCX4753548.1 TetR/AcrR family transcriptional regulator [Kitasatospora purpeofusca]WSR33040.1 TetR/AcrR family transcriptional regulator [Kitasatospora purpeofusca]WSR41109.1 TetR/AcrR family transcriptional regulator [Kitasatospora purpeofusca]